MRSEQKQPQQQDDHQHHQLQHVRTFFPMLCSHPFMIKDVVHIPNPFNKDHSSSSSSSAGRRFDENNPSLSPKVGCMGQVKKKDHHHHHHHHHHNNNNNYNYNLGMVFPTTTTNNTTLYTTKSPNMEVSHGSYNNFSYSKLLRLFSSKTLLATPVPTTHKKIATKNHQGKIGDVSGVNHRRLRSRSLDNNGGFGSPTPINVADLDPPLPVMIKRKTLSSASSVVDGDNNDMNNSLWKRRSGGAALKGLQIKHVHIPIQSTSGTFSI